MVYTVDVSATGVSDDVFLQAWLLALLSVCAAAACRRQAQTEGAALQIVACFYAFLRHSRVFNRRLSDSATSRETDSHVLIKSSCGLETFT